MILHSWQCLFLLILSHYHLLTPWCRVLLEQLTGLQLFKNSRNPKVHYRTHKRPPPVSILGQPNPVHIPTSHLLEIHPNIIHPSTPRSTQWYLYLRFPYQDPIHPPLLTHTRHVPSPSHYSRFYHPHSIGWGVQIIQDQYKCVLLWKSVVLPQVWLTRGRSTSNSTFWLFISSPYISFATCFI